MSAKSAERSAVHALAEQPAALSIVTQWLTPGDFSDLECSGLYAELAALHDARKPIDAVTLAWQAMHKGLDGPVCDSLITQRDPATVSVDPVRASRQVLQQSVRAAVLSTAGVLERMTSAVRGNATAGAYARLNDLWPHQRRLVKAGLSST